jgi:hypothetical protein
MVKYFDVAYLLLWHGRILQQLVDGMRHIFQCTQIYSLVELEHAT